MIVKIEENPMNIINESDIISFFLTLQNQLKTLHWQTKSYAKHKAYGKTYIALDDLVDTFIEVFQGKNPRIHWNSFLSINVYDIRDKRLETFLSDAINVLSYELGDILGEEDKDLLNIRDEIVAELNKLRYLLSLQ